MITIVGFGFIYIISILCISVHFEVVGAAGEQFSDCFIKFWMQVGWRNLRQRYEREAACLQKGVRDCEILVRLVFKLFGGV